MDPMIRLNRKSGMMGRRVVTEVRVVVVVVYLQAVTDVLVILMAETRQRLGVAGQMVSRESGCSGRCCAMDSASPLTVTSQSGSCFGSEGREQPLVTGLVSERTGNNGIQDHDDDEMMATTGESGDESQGRREEEDCERRDRE